ncbi:MAG TPA: proprotein convertase P-domain-containing protein, partial [Polyangiaceae bacterium]|nr:proprotein convertase P-domain-containing protein [Polyangiaceae bacterium]
MTRLGLCCAAILVWACALDRDGSFEAPPGTGGAATAASSTASATNVATVGTGGAAPTCGNGSLEGDEACDDGDAMAGDGCDAACAIEAGWDCSGMPSSCQPIPPTEVSVAQSLPIVDDGYDGNPTSMTCHDLVVTTPYASIQEIRVTVGITHNSIGDLVIKLVSPTNKVMTLLNRPGMNEPDDLGADCSSPPC